VFDLANLDDRGRLDDGEPAGCDRRPGGVCVRDQKDARRPLGELLDQGECPRACVAGAVDDGEAPWRSATVSAACRFSIRTSTQRC
jgi:hypothetical protein